MLTQRTNLCKIIMSPYFWIECTLKSNSLIVAVILNLKAAGVLSTDWLIKLAQVSFVTQCYFFPLRRQLTLKSRFWPKRREWSWFEPKFFPQESFALPAELLVLKNRLLHVNKIANKLVLPRRKFCEADFLFCVEMIEIVYPEKKTLPFLGPRIKALTGKNRNLLFLLMKKLTKCASRMYWSMIVLFFQKEGSYYAINEIPCIHTKKVS